MTVFVEIDRLIPHPDNPRLFLRDEVINSIAEQIKDSGKFDEAHALLVRPVDNDYQIIQGHHRRQGAIKAGLESVPCWVREMTDDEAYKALVMGNVQGELTPLEIGLHILNDVELGVGGQGGKSGLSQYGKLLSKSQGYMSQNHQAAKTYNVYINSVLPITQVMGNTDKSLTIVKRLLSKKSKHLSEIKNLPDEATIILVEEMLSNEWTSKETSEHVKRIKGLVDSVPEWWEVKPDTLVYLSLDKKTTTVKNVIRDIKAADTQLEVVTLYRLEETDTIENRDGRDYQLWEAASYEHDPRDTFREEVNNLTSFPGSDEILNIKRDILQYIQLHSSPGDVWEPVLTDDEWTSKKARQSELVAIEKRDRYMPILHHGDVVKVLRLIRSKSVDLICTDPPYNMDKAEWDTYEVDKFKKWAAEWIKEFYRTLNDTGSLYIFGRFNMLRHLSIIAEDVGFIFKKEIIWDTIQGSGGAGLWPNRHETILYFVKSDDAYTAPEEVKVERHEENIREYKGKEYKFKSLSTVWRFPCVDDKHRERTDHPTQKPVELIDRIIKASCPHDGQVLDPFMGSGTTGVACMKLERMCIGIDNNTEYIEIANGRFGKTEVGSEINSPE